MPYARSSVAFPIYMRRTHSVQYVQLASLILCLIYIYIVPLPHDDDGSPSPNIRIEFFQALQGQLVDDTKC